MSDTTNYSKSELAASEIYEKLDDLEAKAGIASQLAQDDEFGRREWISTVSMIIEQAYR